MLTVGQVLAIESANPQPPWSVTATLGKKYPVRPLRLRPILADVSSHNFIFFVQVRDLSIFKSVNTLDQLQQAWRSTRPTKDSVVQLSKILSQSGASIKWISHDWETVAIHGSGSSLARVTTVRVESNDGVRDIAAGVATVGGGVAIVGGTTAATPIVVVVGGVIVIVGGTTLISLGIYELVTEAAPTQVDAGVTTYGPIPDGADPSDIAKASPVDAEGLPPGGPPGDDGVSDGGVGDGGVGDGGVGGGEGGGG